MNIFVNYVSCGLRERERDREREGGKLLRFTGLAGMTMRDLCTKDRFPPYQLLENMIVSFVSRHIKGGFSNPGNKTKLQNSSLYFQKKKIK